MHSLKYYILFLAFATSACAMFPNTTEVSGNDHLAKISRINLERQKREDDKQIHELMRAELKQQEVRKQKLYNFPKVLTEETLYSEVVYAYQARDLDRLEFYIEAFLKRYPNSVFADNSLYLGGQLALALGLPNEALRFFESVMHKYPMGNKRVAALFGKAVAYRKLHLYEYAEKILNELRTSYPGSPEYYKAELEEKLLSLEKAS